jgi:hypothetical protein
MRRSTFRKADDLAPRSEDESQERLGSEEHGSSLDLSKEGLEGWDPFVDWFVSYWLSRSREVLRG